MYVPFSSATRARVRPMLKGSTFEPDLDKLQRLIHYICHRKRKAPRELGRLKLNKILFYSDLYAFLHTGKPITGEVYIKQKHGPVSKHIDQIVAALKESGHLAVTVEPYIGGGEERTHHLFFSLKEPDIDDFTPNEISIIERYIEEISSKTAQETSIDSHDIVWESRSMRETIPYYSGFLYALGEIREEDLEWARNELAQWGQPNED